MKIINIVDINVIQSWDEKYPVPENYAVVPDDLDTSVFYEYNGFVFITTDEVNGVLTVTKMEANVEAWEEWKKNNPDEPVESEPTADEILDALLGGME